MTSGSAGSESSGSCARQNPADEGRRLQHREPRATNALSQPTSISWDPNIGRPTGITDPNSKTTSADYSDLLDRLKQVTRPDGGRTIYTYTDLTDTVTTTSDITGSGDPVCAPSLQRVDDLIYDGFGRKSVTVAHEAAGTIAQGTFYDGLGRAHLVSLPVLFSSGSAHSAVSGLASTVTNYDWLGRVSSVVEADGVTTTSYSYSQNQTTETAPAYVSAKGATSAQTTTLTDADGRLTGVTDALSSQTTYLYDPLDDLLSVTEAGQSLSSASMTAIAAAGCGSVSRCFVYDSLKRLTKAVNPESGTIGYTYDSNGNLTSRTAPSPNGVGGSRVVTCYGTLTGTSCDGKGYDALNRPIKKSYSDGVTPTATWTYDTTFFGRIASSRNGNSATTYNSYDAMGRPTQTTQTTGETPYVLKYAYDLAGNTETMTYASQRKVNVCADTGGRPSTVTDPSAGGAMVTQTWNPTGTNGTKTVAASGQPSLTSYGTAAGTAMTQQWSYSNDRQQVRQIAATGGGKNLLTLQYYRCPGHGASCRSNNGNVLTQLISADAVGTAAAFSFDQEYGYDALNRLTAAGETGGASGWSQNFAYDLVGNRALVTGSFGASNMQAQASAGATASTVNQLFPDNRWTGATHSDAGNVTVQYPTGPGLTYDAEGRIAGATEPNMTAVSYQYDADGQRMQKTVGTVTTTYVYDAAGQLTAEYGGTPSAGGLQFVAGDALGSTRLVTDSSGNVVERRDYAPFGEELHAGTGGRDATFGTGTYPVAPPNPMEIEFTGKERDSETGLDYFGARYFSSVQGRFTSVDPIWITKERVMDPQRLNLYVYGRNSPLRFIDPDGMDVTLGTCSIGSQQECFAQVQAGLRRGDRAHVHLVLGDGNNGFKKGEYGITVDSDYKSDSKNFQTLQKLAGDHSATARIDVLTADDQFQVRLSLTATRDPKTGQMVEGWLSAQSMTPGFDGYTFYPRGQGAPGPFSIGNCTDVVVNSGPGEVPETIHHELRHVLLGDFGRVAPYGAHHTGQVDQQTTEAEKEAARNKAVK